MTSSLRLGDEEFWLDAADAAEVKRLCAFDRQAGLALARRTAHRASITVPMMMDAAPPAPAQPLRNAAPSPPPVVQGPISMSTKPTHTKTAVGDETLYADARVVAELERLRGENAALKAMRDGAIQPPAAQPVVDALTSSRLAYRDALRADEARRNDPSTPYGAYREYLQNAHLRRDGNRG
ncbi:hypothetical protein E2C06_30635 [Dankookia rubra]|uniref:Uncharacterized protein n=1 Tax=Dankookia rubra TaxID=1442381 RepID=A0A4R5Q9H8_9PROT|nr:hypothetical protein [Dankookia rubra]TDH58827.1 hypothetical protein E2C06_30635 [Dankookia rubra]